MSRGKFISLAEHSPELIQEWDFSKNINFTPQTISYGSAREVHWKCAEGHEWVSSPNDRTRGRGCPECAEAKRKITLRKNIVEKRGSLADRNPDLAQEWHPTKNFPLTAKDILPKEYGGSAQRIKDTNGMHRSIVGIVAWDVLFVRAISLLLELMI